ncbi:hypothetical protein [Clostridium sp. chh4-2]|uniref:hypothetical protein n=1 Tax=Clostridium sp. chh4-2 TaxID=2067550 RepID=UPI0011AF2892|nr:hypothetical protein [Clostridium sp. chh4-2]
MGDINKESCQEITSDEQELTNDDKKEFGSITKTLKEKQKNILSTLKDSRSKNTIDTLWFIWWSIVFGGGLYVS